MTQGPPSTDTKEDKRSSLALSAVDRLLKFLASLQLAVFVIISLAIISAVGTIYEARYDTEIAQKLVYHSGFMYFALLLLCVNLVHVMIDRWPWRRHHLAFLLAHIGIIILLAGSLITRLWGIDGSISFELGRSNRYVTLPDREILISSVDSQGREELITRESIDFVLRPPREGGHKYQYEVGGLPLKILEYAHFGEPRTKMERRPAGRGGPALRVQLQNERVNLSEWLSRDPRQPYIVRNLGPARLVVSDGSYQASGGNEIIFVTKEGVSDSVEYEIYTESQGGRSGSGRLRVGETVATGWMGLELRLIGFLSSAEEVTEFESRPTKISETLVPAMRFSYQGEERWVGLNSVVKLYGPEKTYYVQYRNVLMPLDFSMRLENFTVGRYQGTMRAMSYQSDVLVEGYGPAKIYMNNPLKFRGYTFYQASFTEDEMGRPTSSILSVNRDPGRPWKNLGSFLIVLGTIHLFYFKRRRLPKVARSKE